MPRPNINDLIVFMTIARERSFARAAAHLGMSPSAASHAMRCLEERLGIRLLNRTTRSVLATEAGKRLLEGIGDHLQGIDDALADLMALRNKPAGTIRITATEYAAVNILWPALEQILPEFPDVKVEVDISYRLTDIVAEGFDAGIRMGEIVCKDMIAVPIGPEMRMAVVGSPRYFQARSIPLVPQDLTQHSGINLRLPTHGGLHSWEFEKDGQESNVRLDGQLTFNTTTLMLNAARSGLGLAYLPEEEVVSDLENRTLVRVLADWCPRFAGYRLYFPSRRQHTPAFTLLLNALRYQN